MLKMNNSNQKTQGESWHGKKQVIFNLKDFKHNWHAHFRGSALRSIIAVTKSMLTHTNLLTMTLGEINNTASSSW